MAETLREKLLNEVDVVDWRSLEPHYKRGAVIVVDGALDLIEVAIAVAEDDTDQVKGWLDSEAIRKASPDDEKEWSVDPDLKFAEFLILQPYVLLQKIKH